MCIRDRRRGRAQGPAPVQPARAQGAGAEGRRGVIPFVVETAAAQVVEVLDPATRQYFDTAVESERARDFERAIAAYRLVLTRNPDFSPASLGLARCYALTRERV